MEIQDIIISAFITIFSVGLLTISIASYRKYKNKKLLFVSLVFLIFLVKGIILTSFLFSNEPTNAISLIQNGVFDLIILILLFIATLKR